MTFRFQNVYPPDLHLLVPWPRIASEEHDPLILLLADRMLCVLSCHLSSVFSPIGEISRTRNSQDIERLVRLSMVSAVLVSVDRAVLTLSEVLWQISLGH